MFVGKPVGRIRVAGGLGRVVFLGAARHSERACHRRRGGLHLIGDIVGPGGKAIGHGLRHRRLRGSQQSDQQREK